VDSPLAVLEIIRLKPADQTILLKTITGTIEFIETVNEPGDVRRINTGILALLIRYFVLDNNFIHVFYTKLRVLAIALLSTWF
jgi:hypothetical protein